MALVVGRVATGGWVRPRGGMVGTVGRGSRAEVVKEELMAGQSPEIVNRG